MVIIEREWLIGRIREIINDGELTKEEEIKFKEILADKKKQIYLFRKINSLLLDEDLVKAYKLKIENEKKSILNNKQINEKKKEELLEKINLEYSKDLKYLEKLKGGLKENGNKQKNNRKHRKRNFKQNRRGT